MKREWTLYFAASTALLALYIASRFALDRGAAGEAARTNPLAVVVACTLVSVPTFLFATEAGDTAPWSAREADGRLRQ